MFDPSTTDVTAVSGKTEPVSTSDNTNVSVSEAKKKGVIEVVNISDAHMAECRILESINSNPLLPGDVIFTPLWHPGQQEHFALVGLLSIDGKGNSDRQKIHDIIRIHGGVIDAETDDKGNVHGEITHLTRYLVEGDLTEHEARAIHWKQQAHWRCQNHGRRSDRPVAVPRSNRLHAGCRRKIGRYEKCPRARSRPAEQQFPRPPSPAAGKSF